MKEGKQILTVTLQKPIATWRNKKDTADVTLYEVKAVDEHGQPVTEELRTFSELPIGEALEYEIEAYSHPRHGDSWTLKKPRENTSARVRKLEGQVQSLADRVAALEERTMGSQVIG